MSDEVFHDVAYKARKREHLLAGIDEFLDAVTVLPPGEWDPSIRIEPPQQVPSQVTIQSVWKSPKKSHFNKVLSVAIHVYFNEMYLAHVIYYNGYNLLLLL